MPKLIAKIADRVQNPKKNQCVLMLFIGGPGSGKSESAGTTAEQITAKIKEPLPQRVKIVFFANELMDALKAWGKHSKGRVLIWDDAGVGLPADEWYSVLTKAVTRVVQSFRDKNLVFIVTTPFPEFVPPKVRKLFHYLVEMEGVNELKGKAYGKVFKIQPSGRQHGKIYYKHPINYYNGKRTKTKRLIFNQPSQEYRDYYYPLRALFREKVDADADRDIKTHERKKERQSFQAREFAVKLLERQDLDKFLSSSPIRGQRRLSQSLIEAEYGLGGRRALQVKKLAEIALKERSDSDLHTQP